MQFYLCAHCTRSNAFVYIYQYSRTQLNQKSHPERKVEISSKKNAERKISAECHCGNSALWHSASFHYL